MTQDDTATHDDTPTSESTGNGAASADSKQVQLVVNAQYVKDLSFENPRAPQSLIQQKGPPDVSLDVDVKARSLAHELYEVMLTISVEAKAEGETVFIVQLSYGAVVTAKNATQELLPSMILIETPRLMFPFARNVVAEATRDGGFPPLLINPIDFAELLRREQAKQAAAGETTTTA
jgi:preprotein translocase subunit SecB